MHDLKEVAEDFHRPRLAALAEYFLTSTKLRYEFFGPPTLELYLLQVHLDEDTIVSMNYLPVELDENLPYLFLQIFCSVAEEIKPSDDLSAYILFANNNTLLSTFHLEGNQVYLKSVLTQDPEASFDFEVLMFNLGIFKSNLHDHQESLQAIIKGKMNCEEAIRTYQEKLDKY